MKTLNKVMLLGSVGRDPELKSTGGGTLVANLSLATTRRYKDGGGNWKDETDWHNLVAYAKTAEIIRDYVQKGSPIHVEGHLQTRSWDDKATGKKVYRTEVFIESLILLGGNKDKRQGPAPTAREMGFPDNGHEVSDEDIPF